MPVDATELRKVLGHFATGVTLVTTVHGSDGAQAMTVNSFTSVSLVPPLVLFCADKRSRTHHAVAASGVFAVNLLREDQRVLSDLFAGQGTDEDRRAALAKGRVEVTGSPILDPVLGFLDCKVVAAHDAGDHVIYIGEVVAAGAGDPAAPLLYYRGTYQALDQAWRWRDRSTARAQATQFHDMVDFFDRMQNEGPYAGLLERLLALADPPPDARCIDIGCGAGRLTRELGARCREATGVDAAAPMLERAAANAKAQRLENVRFLESEATALPFPDASFDLAVASNLLFHLPDPAAALREVARVLRPGGRVALLEPTTSMGRAAMTAFLEDIGTAQLGAHALLVWADAAEAGRRYGEEQLTSDLHGAGIHVLRTERELGGLAVIAIAERGEAPRGP